MTPTNSPPAKAPGCLLTYDEAAVRLGVCVRTLKSWVAARKLRAIRITPKVVRFRECDLEGFISRKATIAY